MTVRRPILVTGTHRSGTTWVGRMLDLSPGAHYVHEPFAPMNHRSWLVRRQDERYLHLPPDRPTRFDDDLDRIVALRPPPVALLRRARSGRDLARAMEQVASARHARRAGQRAIIKDPFALLLAEWLQVRTDADVIVCVRHPAAFVSSVKRLDWRLDEQWLLGQDELVEGDLRTWVPALERADRLDLVDHACLVWRALNSVVRRLEDDHPDWVVTRYEDLALDPVPSFADLYQRLGLPWTSAIAEDVRRLNAPDNPTEVPSDRRGGVVRDSRSAVWTWRDRLTGDEVERVRTATQDVAAHWYGGEDWWAPPVPRRRNRAERSYRGEATDPSPRPAIGGPPEASPGVQAGAEAGPLVAIFGAPDDTGNLGVSALGQSVLRAVGDIRPDVRRLVFDHQRGRRCVTVPGIGTYERDGAWNSRRLHRSESLWSMRANSILHLPRNRNVQSIREADLVLDITGGDSFTDLYGSRRWWSSILPKQIAISVGTPLVLLPQTYGPFDDPERRTQAAEIVSRARLAWARDPDGLQQLQELLGPRFDPVRHRQGVDVAFALPAQEPPDLPERLSELLRPDRDVPTVGLNVSGLLMNDRGTAAADFGLALDYPRAMEELASRLLRCLDANLVLVPHVRGGSWEADDPACASLAAALDRPDRVVMLPTGLGASETKWCVSRMDWFCGTRMHSTIAALSSGVPAAAVAYSHKTRGVFDTCGMGHAVVDARTVGTDDAVSALVDRARARDDDRVVLGAHVDDVVTRAAAQFEEILSTCLPPR